VTKSLLLLKSLFLQIIERCGTLEDERERIRCIQKRRNEPHLDLEFGGGGGGGHEHEREREEWHMERVGPAEENDQVRELASTHERFESACISAILVTLQSVPYYALQ
jgi:hypothetical protein